MPNRIIRDAILSSEKVALLGWPEEVFYRRLMSIVDDYGRTEANPQLLRARCYPLQTDTVRVADISRWMAACQKSGLILDYAVNGKRYLELINFQQQQRSPSKWPAPASADSACEQLIADAPVFGVGDEGVSDKPAAPSGAGLFEEFWKVYPKKKAKDDALKAFVKRKPDAALVARMVDAVAAQSMSPEWQKDGGQFIPYPATWLNDGRWQDESVTLPIAMPSKSIEHTNQLLRKQDEHAAEAEARTPEQKAATAERLRQARLAITAKEAA